MNQGKNILVITYWSIDSALIHTYTLPYLRQIKSCLKEDAIIYLLTLSPPSTLTKTDTRAFIEQIEKENIKVLNFTYYPFGIRMVFSFLFLFPYLFYFTIFKKIRSLHAWCTPGGAIAWPISVLTRKPLVLDSFEPHAESMLESGTWKKSSISYRILLLMEKLQLKRASEVICATEAMIGYSQKIYGITKPRYFVKPAGVDTDLFYDKQTKLPALPLNLKNKVCVYAGKFGGIYLDEEIFDFFKTAYDYWNHDFSVLLLSHHSEEEIRHYCLKSNLPESCVTLKAVAHHEVPAYLNLADFAITPVKPLPSKLYCSPIKDGEYWAMGLPVVITKNISNDSRLIEENKIGYVLQNHSKEEYLRALHTIDSLINKEAVSKKIRALAIEHRAFEKARSIYQTIYATNEVC